MSDEPFPKHPHFKTVAEYARWYARTFPDAPSYAMFAAAGNDPRVYLDAAEVKRGE